MIRRRFAVIGFVLGFALAAFLYSRWSSVPSLPNPETVLKITVPEKATFGDLARWLHFPTGSADAIVTSSKSEYDLAKIVSGRELALTYDTFTGGLKRLVYKIDSEERLVAEDGETGWTANKEAIPYEIKEAATEGVIADSLYEAVVSGGGDPRLALAIAEMFAWQVDFVADTKEGDSFKVIYEERHLNGEYAMPGKILAARYTNDGEAFYGYWFNSETTRPGHYDRSGEALQKQFLKAPLQYRYISSGFSYGRVNPVTKIISPHRAIDYAAPTGTPAVTVGDGTVIQAGWNGDYGISVTIRHNDTYKSIYGHFSRLAKGVRVGTKVKQGQVIGYVGSTGQTTGPHLHYEMFKFGSRVNPFKVEVPPGEPVAEEDKDVFAETAAKYQGRL